MAAAKLRLPQDLQIARKLLDEAKPGSILIFKEPSRTDIQNERFHASIRNFAEQLKWAGDYIDEEDWKRLIIASFYGQKVIPGLLGGFVVLSKKSSQMSKADMAELQEFIYAYGSEKGVTFPEES